MLKRGQADRAAECLEAAVERFPYSRTYINLARAYVDLGKHYSAETDELSRKARRCIDHAQSLGAVHGPTSEMTEILAEIAVVDAPSPADRMPASPARAAQ
jgi:hypothetical protein